MNIFESFLAPSYGRPVYGHRDMSRRPEYYCDEPEQLYGMPSHRNFANRHYPRNPRHQQSFEPEPLFFSNPVHVQPQPGHFFCPSPLRQPGKQFSHGSRKYKKSPILPVSSPVSENSAKIDRRNELSLETRLRRNYSAKIIQRGYRSHLKVLQVKKLEKQNRACHIITNFLRRFLAKKSTQSIVESLKKLWDCRAQIEQLKNSYQNYLQGSPYDSKGRVKYELLEYEERLIQILLRMDKIESYGSETVRSLRKILVQESQNCLSDIDEFRNQPVPMQDDNPPPSPNESCMQDVSDSDTVDIAGFWDSD